MKLFVFLTAALISLSAQAQHRFEMVNSGGGKIVLTMLKCKGKYGEGLLHAYTFTKSGRMGEGCWAYFDDRVQVLWDDGDRRVYEPQHFIEYNAPEPSKSK